MRRTKFLNLILIGTIFVTMLFCSITNWTLTDNHPKITESYSTSRSNSEICSEITKDHLSGSGNNVKTGLYTNISAKTTIKTPYYEEPGYKFFDLPINTYYQNITQTNLTFSEIEAYTTLHTIEDNPEDYLYFNPPYWVAMSIKIPTPCTLKKLQLFVQESNQTAESPSWTVKIYNATRQLNYELNIFPDTFTGAFTSLQVAGTPAAHWHNFTFSNVQLNMSNTYIDAKGFAYYFFKILMPQQTIDSRFLYFSYDQERIGNEWVYFGTTESEHNPLAIDICMRMELAPLNTNPLPSDVQLAVKNPDRPFSNIAVESNHSLPVQTFKPLIFFGSYFPSQNITLTDYGTIQNISLYLKYSGGNNTFMVGILPANFTGVGPLFNGNKIYDGTTVQNVPNGYEGWYTFSMPEQPNLRPGQYWWILLFTADAGSNLTLYGAADPPDKAIALNITILTTFDAKILPFNFANIIGITYGQEFFNVTKSWISTNFFISDIFGYYHYTIVTRWEGTTRINVTHYIELENIMYIQSNYYSPFQSKEALWNVSIQATFPITNLGKIINLTVPRDWNVRNVTINGRNHGNNNWTIYPQQAYRIISIHNSSNGKWTIWCNSTVYQVDYVIEKLIGGQFQPTLNATVYDRLRINVTTVNQTNGMCNLIVFYPDNKTIYTNQILIMTKYTILSWYPENDSAATGGIYTFLVFWSNGTELGYNKRYFLFTPIPTNLTLASSLPSPYINDITKTFMVRYNDSRGINILGATISAKLSGILLEWEDVYSKSLNPQDKGLYRIKLNTTGLNANQYYSLSISAQKDGYKNISLSVQQIWVRPVPTSLVRSFTNITQYQNEFISFSCSYKDTFHGTGIDWASIHYIIVGTNINGTMTGIMPGESVYVANNIKLHNLTERTAPYSINITATALNCEIANIIIDLYVINKTGTRLTISIPTGSLIQGQSIQLQALLLNESSQLGIPNAYVRFSFGGIIPERIALTDSNGFATIEISIPDESFYVTVSFDETSSISATSTTSLLIKVLSYANLALWIGIVAFICTASILAIRQFYIVPKRNRKVQRYQKIANKFKDAVNIRQILILHKDSGVCVFQQSFGGIIDGDLISGFLQAISSFQTELKPEKLPQKEAKTGGFELNYKDYKILLFEGTIIRLAFVVEETPSEAFQKLAESLVGEYEESYHEPLVRWHGDIEPFKTSTQFIAKKLELTLIWPHQLRKPAPSEKFTTLEESVIRIADTIMKSQVTNYVFLSTVISLGQAGVPQSKLEIVVTVYNLRYRDVFIPIDPSSLPT